MDDLPPVPGSFLVAEDVDSLTLGLRHERAATRIQWPRGVRGPRSFDQLHAVVLATVFVVVVGSGRQGKALWALVTAGVWPEDPRIVFGLVLPVGALLLGVAALAIARMVGVGVERSVAEETTEWVMEPGGLRVPGEGLIPWHAMESVVEHGDAIHIHRRDGDKVVGQAGRHARLDRTTLVKHLSARVARASVSEADRRALHDAARKLTDGA